MQEKEREERERDRERERERDRYLESIGMFLVTRYLLSPASVRAIITFAFVQDFS